MEKSFKLQLVSVPYKPRENPSEDKTVEEKIGSASLDYLL